MIPDPRLHSWRLARARSPPVTFSLLRSQASAGRRRNDLPGGQSDRSGQRCVQHVRPAGGRAESGPRRTSSTSPDGSPNQPTMWARTTCASFCSCSRLSVLLAWLHFSPKRFTRSDRGQLEDVSVYFGVLRRDMPEKATRAGVRITLTDGSEIRGAVRAYTTGEDPDKFIIALGGAPILQSSATNGSEWNSIAPFDAVIIPSASIRLLKVQYMDADGNTHPAASPDRSVHRGARRGHERDQKGRET